MMIPAPCARNPMEALSNEASQLKEEFGVISPWGEGGGRP